MSKAKKEEKTAVLDRFKGDFALFIEAGFVAVKQMDEMSAMHLFQSASLLDPDSVVPYVGLGYIALNKLEIKKATEIFQDVLKKEPDHHLANVLLGMCYLLKRKTREQGEELIKKMEKVTDDPSIINLCSVALEWSKKDLNNSKAPFFQKK